MKAKQLKVGAEYRMADGNLVRFKGFDGLGFTVCEQISSLGGVGFADIVCKPSDIVSQVRGVTAPATPVSPTKG